MTVVSGVFGGGWLFNILTLRAQRKKADAEATTTEAQAESVQIDNAAKIIAMWQDYVSKKEAADAIEKKSLTDKMGELETMIQELKSSNKSLMSEVRMLRKAIAKAKECPGAENCPSLANLEKTE